MIVPRTSLLAWTGLVVVPFAAIGAAFPGTGGASFAAIAIFLGTVLIDAASAGRGLAGVKPEFPGTVRMIRDREAVIEFLIRNGGPKARQVRVGLAFPGAIAPASEELSVDLPGGDVTSLFRWPCRPRKRGRYLFTVCYLEGSSPMGLWAVRRSVPVQCEVRVYPNLSPERKNLAALFLSRGDFGFRSRRQTGQGREFEKLREYVHGDTYEHIHWKTTAKRGRPVTKLFQVERTQEVYVIIDASRLSSRPAPSELDERRRATVVPGPGAQSDGSASADQSAFPRETLLERFITAALVMGVAAERQGDLFGLATFSDRVHKFVRAKSGSAHYSGCRDAVYRLQPRMVTPDYDDICSFIGLRLRRRSLLVFLTSLDNPLLAESFERNMELLRKKHLILVGMLRPAGAHPLFSGPDRSCLDDVYRDFAGHLLWHDLRELEKVLQRQGVRFFLLDNERLCPQLVSRYMDVKQGQLL